MRDLWDSVDSGKLQKAIKKGGLCPRPRRPEFGEGSYELLTIVKIGSNGRAVPVLIAYCGLEKAWHRDSENRALINSSPDLVNKDIKANPFISDFTARYPLINYNQTDDDDGSPEPAITRADTPAEGEGQEAPEPVGWGPTDMDLGMVAEDEEDEEGEGAGVDQLSVPAQAIPQVGEYSA